MKPIVAVTLIIGGIFVVALPPLADAWRTWMFTRLMEHGAHSVIIEGDMPNLYRFGCWLLGAAMIAVAVIASRAPSSIDSAMRQRAPGGE
jgi:hypothetical protein